MKAKIVFSLFMVVMVPLIFLSSCSNFKNLAAFDVAYTMPRTTFTFTPVPLKAGGEQLLYSGSVAANLDSIMNSHGVSSGIVGNTFFTKCSITIQSPSTLTFDWLQSARAEISLNPDFSPSQEVGSVTNTTPQAKTVVLVLNNTNIRPYLGSRFFYFRVFGVLNGTVPSQFVQMYMDGQLQMHIEPL